MIRSADQIRGEEDAADQRFMSTALMLARRGLGLTAPNPSVGAVIVRGSGDGAEVVGRGWTGAGGRPHAETIALGRAGDRARGATLYVTLEPCSHHGKTPPCTDAIVAAGISRVVAAHADPDPRVSGSGFSRLKGAAIAVRSGVLESEAKWVNAGHICRHTRDRPFVQLKVAVAADGLIAAGDGKPRWVTGPEARARSHLLRAQADAILVGIGTIEADDPELSCRLPGLGLRSPEPVVLDSRLRTRATSAIMRRVRPGHRVWIFTTVEEAARTGSAVWQAGALVVDGSGKSGSRVDLHAVLDTLRVSGVTRLLVEGGPTIARAFLEQSLVDEIVVFTGGEPLPADARQRALRPFVDRGLELLAANARWRSIEDRAVGADRMIVYRSVC